jgi:hypothetical protein
VSNQKARFDPVGIIFAANFRPSLTPGDGELPDSSLWSSKWWQVESPGGIVIFTASGSARPTQYSFGSAKPRSDPLASGEHSWRRRQIDFIGVVF